MRYFTFVQPGEDEKPEYITMSEDEILDDYWSFWSERMIQKYGYCQFIKEFSRQDCIDDWVVVHWAWESKDER